MNFNHVFALLACQPALMGLARAEDCSFGPPRTNITCPSGQTTTAFCSSESLKSNIIFRCINGCPQPGNCNDNLAAVPPVGVKRGAYCWEETRTSGNAQCTFDCVQVTAENGTKFYPVGCSFDVANGTAAPSSVSLTIFGTSTSGAGSSPTTGSEPSKETKPGSGHSLVPSSTAASLIFLIVFGTQLFWAI